MCFMRDAGMIAREKYAGMLDVEKFTLRAPA